MKTMVNIVNTVIIDNMSDVNEMVINANKIDVYQKIRIKLRKRSILILSIWILTIPT